MATEPVLKDSPLRSVLKGITYRIVGTASTALIAWAVTGRIEAALTIGSVEFVSKIFIYYFHERAWAQIPLGTVRRLPEKLGARRALDKSS